jgi:hypothetical protein
MGEPTGDERAADITPAVTGRPSSNPQPPTRIVSSCTHARSLSRSTSGGGGIGIGIASMLLAVGDDVEIYLCRCELDVYVLRTRCV